MEKDKIAMRDKTERRIEAEYAEMEKHCPEKVRRTTRQPVAALEYQKKLISLRRIGENKDV